MPLRTQGPTGPGTRCPRPRSHLASRAPGSPSSQAPGSPASRAPGSPSSHRRAGPCPAEATIGTAGTGLWTTACRSIRDVMMLATAPEARCIGQPRLTAGLDRFRRIDLAGFHLVFGRLPRPPAERLIEMAEQVDLRGRGGAAFPVAHKLTAVLDAARTRRRTPIVLVNGAEGEPGSAKDRMLLLRSPYLVLGGALVAAQALHARDILVGVTDPLAARSVREAAASEPVLKHMVGVVELPDRFVSGESGALVNAVNGRAALPSADRTHNSYKGAGHRPTLLSNAETFAQLAILAMAG